MKSPKTDTLPARQRIALMPEAHLAGRVVSWATIPIRPDRSRSPARGAPTEENGSNGRPNPPTRNFKTDKNRYWGLTRALMRRPNEDSFARPGGARHVQDTGNHPGTDRATASNLPETYQNLPRPGRVEMSRAAIPTGKNREIALPGRRKKVQKPTKTYQCEPPVTSTGSCRESGRSHWHAARVRARDQPAFLRTQLRSTERIARPRGARHGC